MTEGSRHPEEAAANCLRGKSYVNGDTETCSPSDAAGGTFTALQNASQSLPNDPEKAREYLAVGLTLSNELCDGWFTDIGRARTTLRETSDVISSVGNLTISMLDLARAKRPSPAFTATLFGVLKTSVDNLDANYVVMADIPTVKAAVKRYRGKYAKEIEGSNGNWNYYTARRVIMAYDNTCSSQSVHEFIKVKIEGGKVDNQLVQVQSAAFDKLVADAAALFESDAVVTVDSLVNLYAYSGLQAQDDPAVRDALKASLIASKIIDGATGKLRFKNADGAATLNKKIQEASLNVYLGSLASARIDRLRASMATEDAPGRAEAEKGKKVLDAFIAALSTDANKKPGWGDLFAFDGNQDVVVQLYLYYSDAYAAAPKKVKAALLAEFDDRLFSGGKMQFRAGKTSADFAAAISESNYPSLKAFLETQAKARVKAATEALAPPPLVGKPAAAKKPETNPASGSSGNKWAMPLAPSGRSLDVPPPIESTD